MAFHNRPTVAEVNRYLRPVIQELRDKHTKVSHPEFDGELRSRTGIGWKQAKDYRNHPNPAATISDNAKVLPFVLEQRTADRFYVARRLALYLVGALLLAVLAFSLLTAFRNAKDSENLGLDVLIDQKFRELQKNGEFAECPKEERELIHCPEGSYYFKGGS